MGSFAGRLVIYMALTQEEEQFYKIYLKKHGVAPDGKKAKPVHIKILQFSMVFFSMLLFITVGTLGILVMSRPQLASAANTYTETWTATNGVYGTGAAGNYQLGIPAANTSCAIIAGAANSCVVTVTAWSVSGTIN